LIFGTLQKLGGWRVAILRFWKTARVAKKVNARVVSVDFALDAIYLGYNRELSSRAATIGVRSGWGEKELQA